MDSVSNISIQSVICEPTQGSQQVYHRPFGIAVSDVVAEGINQLGSDVGISSFTSASVSNGISNAITHQQVGTPVFMPYGWNQKRLKVLMSVLVQYVSGNTERLDFQGYTDYYDPSATIPLAPESTFFINNVTVVVINEMQGHTMEKVIASNQLLANETMRNTTNEQIGMNNIYSLRPQDVVVKMEQATTDTQGWNTDDNYQDTSAQLGSVTEMSRRTNNSPGRYLSDLLNAYGMASQISEMEIGTSNVMSGTYSNLIEDSVSSNKFLRHMSDSLNSRHVTGSFTFRELLQVYPTLFQDGVVHMIPEVTVPTMFSERLDIHDVHSVMANTLAQQTVSAMYRAGLSWVRVSANNRGSTNLDGPMVTVTKADTLLKQDNPAGAVSTFTSIFKTEIMPYITKCDNMVVSVAVDSSTTRGTDVSVMIDGDGNTEPVTYSYPSYADHLYPPILDTESTSEIGLGLELLYNSMTSGYLQGFDEQPAAYGIPNAPVSPAMMDDFSVPAVPTVTGTTDF